MCDCSIENTCQKRMHRTFFINKRPGSNTKPPSCRKCLPTYSLLTLHQDDEVI